VATRTTIGLTGDVGSGKSTVLRWLADHGAATLDADAVVHQLLAGDAGVIAAVVARFGADVRVAQAVDRAKLAAAVFGDAAALAALERIVHPAVIDYLRRWIDAAPAPVVAVEAVKLIESGLNAEFDQTWLVTCDGALRRARLIARGWSAAEADRRIAAGTPLAPRLAVADVVIDNSGSSEATCRQLEVAWARLGAVGRSPDAGTGATARTFAAPASQPREVTSG
jgi:dephospho-CoA kinase